MNELKTLMSQQVDLLKNQIEEQNKSLKLSEKYTKQLIEQNELLIQENQVKSELILTLKEQIANIKLKKPSDVFTDVRIQHESAFTNAVKESVRSIEPTAHSQSIHSEQNQSITATTFGTDIETFITEYSIKQRDERRRAIQQDTELRRINQQLGKQIENLM